MPCFKASSVMLRKVARWLSPDRPSVSGLFASPGKTPQGTVLMSALPSEHDKGSRTSTRSGPHVAILLTTYNGARFLVQQLDSIAGQSHGNWTLYVSDDGSTDETLDILQSYCQTLGDERLRLFHGPRLGFAQNFLSLIRNPAVRGDYFAFSDQDDIWFTDKLTRSLACFPHKRSEPALYCSRTRLVDEDGNVIGYSPLFRKAPTFSNALVQSIAGANTMLLNSAARNLLAHIPEHAQIASHDWLCYLLVTGCGGDVHYDAEPTLDYRQHGSNLIGSNSGVHDRLVRIRKLLAGTFSEWIRQNLQSIDYCGAQLDTHNRNVLELFCKARQASLLRRFYLLRRAGVYRQTPLGTLGLFLAAGLGKI